MGISLRVDPDSGIVYITTSGSPSVDEQRDLWRQIGRLPGIRQPLRVLDDRRGLETFAETSDVRAARDFAAKISEWVRDTRIATVVPEAAAFGMARMFQAYSDDLPLELRAFYDYDEAERWLLDGSDPALPVD